MKKVYSARVQNQTVKMSGHSRLCWQPQKWRYFFKILIPVFLEENFFKNILEICSVNFNKDVKFVDRCLFEGSVSPHIKVAFERRFMMSQTNMFRNF